jgi:hypothetical protein
MRSLISFFKVAIMTSALVRATGSLSALKPTTQLQPYTIIFTTPLRASPTFLHDLRQSSLSPQFVGEDSVFFRKKQPTNWGWSHIIILPGADVQFPPTWGIRQRWSFGLEAEKELSTDDGERDSNAGFEAGMKSSGHGQAHPQIEGPEDLKEALKYWLRMSGKTICPMNFVGFENEKSKKAYEAHLSSLQNPSGNPWNARVHLSGRVTSTSQDHTFANQEAHDAEPMDHVTLMSFTSDGAFSEYLLSEEYKRLEDKGIKGGWVLTQELKLPPKHMVIDKYGWEYGNPYEPYGEDWFG